MSDKPDRILMCTPTHMPSGMPANAIEIDADCGHRVWISQSGLIAQLTGTFTAVKCIDCITFDQDTKMEAVPGAEDELAVAFGDRGGAQQLIASAGVDPQFTLQLLQRDSRAARNRRR